MGYYNGIPKEKVLEIYKFVMLKRKELACGQRTLFRMVREKFKIEIKENTIAGWIFRKIVPFANEKTWFKSKQEPKRKEIYERYITQGRSAEDIAREYRISTATAIKWLKSSGIATRSHKDAMNTRIVKRDLRERKLTRPKKDFRTMTPEKAYIFGVLCGDAHINRKFIRLEIRRDEEFIKGFVKCFEKVYGLKYNYSYYTPKNTFVTQINAELLCQDLLSYGNFGTENWNVPTEIIDSDNEKMIGAFLKGFYDSEGSVSRCTITSSSINGKGLEQVKNLLKTLGIESTLKPQQKGRYYVLYIFRKERFERFKERVGFTIKRKLDKINETLNTGFFTRRSVADT